MGDGYDGDTHIYYGIYFAHKYYAAISRPICADAHGTVSRTYSNGWYPSPLCATHGVLFKGRREFDYGI